MTSTPPESAEVVGARARARVAAPTPRRPVTVHVVSPVVRAEQTPVMMPPPPSAYVPRPVATSPTATWEESIGGPREELLAGLRRALAASLAGATPREGDVAHYSGRDPVWLDDVDDYVSGAR